MARLVPRTHHLSNLLDIILKPLRSHITSVSRDEIDFLSRLSKTAKVHSLIFSLDVINLYTNIPHERGLLLYNIR